MTKLRHQRGLHLVASLEAFKGAVVLIVGFGLLSFLGRDADEFAGQLLRRLHLNPAHHYPQIFIHAMADVTDARVWLLAGLAAAYSLLRFMEAYGLWKGRRWAEWLAALSGGIYIPFEVYEIIRHATWLKFIALALNIVIVGYMAWLLSENRRRARAEMKVTGAG